MLCSSPGPSVVNGLVLGAGRGWGGELLKERK